MIIMIIMNSRTWSAGLHAGALLFYPTCMMFGLLFSVPGTRFLTIGGKFIPEPIFLLLVLALDASCGNVFARLTMRLRQAKYGIIFAVLFILMMYGYLNHQDFRSAYQDFRAMVMMGLMFLIVRYCIDEHLHIKFVTTFVMASTIFTVLFYGVSGAYGNDKSDFAVSLYFLASYLAIWARSWLVLLLLFVPLLFISVVSGFRIQILASLFALAVAVFCLSIPVISRGMVDFLLQIRVMAMGAILLFVSSAAMLVALFSTQFETWIKSYDVLYSQVWIKSKLFFGFLTGDEHSQDESTLHRVDMILAPVVEFDSFVVPYGLGAWAFYENSPDNYHPLDSGFLALACYLGTPIAVLLIIGVCFLFYRNLFAGKNLLPNDVAVWLWSSSLFWLLYVIAVTGTVFAQPVHSVPFGVLLAVMAYRLDPQIAQCSDQDCSSRTISRSAST